MLSAVMKKKKTLGVTQKKKNKKKLQLYGNLPLISQTIRVRRCRHAGHCWGSKDKHISDVLKWTPVYGHASVGRTAKLTSAFLQTLDRVEGTCQER